MILKKVTPSSVTFFPVLCFVFPLSCQKSRKNREFCDVCIHKRGTMQKLVDKITNHCIKALWWKCERHVTTKGLVYL